MRGYDEVSIYSWLIFLLISYYIRLKLKKRALLAFLGINLIFVYNIMCEIYNSERIGFIYLCIYLLIFYIQHHLLKNLIHKKNYKAFIPILFPIIILIISKTFPFVGYLNFIFLIGISYISFKTTHMAILVRNKSIVMPTLLELYVYVLYAPTIFVGPINSAKDFFDTLKKPICFKAFPPFISINRIIIGLVKYFYLSSVVSQLTFNSLWSSGHEHTALDFLVSSIASYLTLYMNFSGFCDIVIGVSGLLGIKINENFDNPLLARNLKDFWNRWHVTLSFFIRDLVFNPIIKFLMNLQIIKPSYLSLVASFTTIFIFLLIGVWHGLAWNYVVFGLLHGLGIVFIQYYNVLIAYILGKKYYRYYINNLIIKIFSTVITFMYISFTFFIFENDIFSIIDILLYLIH